MQYKMIVALCRGGGIGFKGSLPWPKLARDMRFFAKMTSSTTTITPFTNAVIMGRKTWDSLPVTAKPLKYRDNIIISSKEETPDVQEQTCVRYIKNISQIPYSIQKYDVAWIIGGASIYHELLLNQHISIDEIYITFIDEQYEFDTSFPLLFQYETVDEMMNLENNVINRKIWCWNDAETIPKFLSFNNEYLFSVQDVDREFVSQITTQADISGIRERRIPDMRFLKLKRLFLI